MKQTNKNPEKGEEWSRLRTYFVWQGFPCGSADKESTCSAGDLGSIPGLESPPGEGKGYPLQYSGLENSMDCIVHGVTKNRTRLSGFHCSFQIPCISEIIQYLSFSVWLIALSIMPSKSTQFAVNSLTILLPWVLAGAKREREEERKLAAPDQETGFSRCPAWSHTCLTDNCGHAGLRGMVWDSLLSCCVIWSPSPSVAHLCLTLWPMDCSTPGFPLLHHLPEFAQIPAHWDGDAIQPPHPLSSPSPPALNLSQPQSLFQWVSSSHQVAKVLELQLQHQSFQWVFRVDFL